jgi:hypothetical protein
MQQAEAQPAATASWSAKVKSNFANDPRVRCGNAARYEECQLDKDALCWDVVPTHQGLQLITSPGIGHIDFDQLEQISPKFFDCHFLRSQVWQFVRTVLRNVSGDCR